MRQLKVSKSKKLTKDAQRKQNFRASPEWWAMRAELISEQKVDPITKAKLTKKANCHHKDLRVDNYESLDKTRYVMLQPLTHKLVHFLYRLYKKQGEAVFNSLRKLFNEMDLYSND